MIALPSFAGGFHDTTSALSANWTVGAAGRPGSMSGVTTGDGPLHGPQPATLCARTLNCTPSPLVRPVHVYPVVLPMDWPPPSPMRIS